MLFNTAGVGSGYKLITTDVTVAIGVGHLGRLINYSCTVKMMCIKISFKKEVNLRNCISVRYDIIEFKLGWAICV